MPTAEEWEDPSESADRRTLFRPAAELLEESSRAAEGNGEAELRRYAERLRLLNEVHQALGRPIEQRELLGLILDKAFAHLQPQEGAIYLRDPEGAHVCAASRSSGGSGETPFYSSHLVHEVAEKGLAALVLDVERDERFAKAESILMAGMRSLVAAPLLDPQGSLGMIVLGSKALVRSFTEEDMDLLTSLSSAAALRIRNVALAEEAAQRQRLEREMTLARRIQQALIPDALPPCPGWELYASNRPSQHVSGDYYTALLREEHGDLAFMVADVAGKGMGASLVTGYLEALCAGLLEAGLPPHEVFARASANLLRRTPPEKYATAFLGALDPRSGRLKYANAGHLPGLVLEAGGGARWLKGTGFPLGLVDRTEYAPEETSLEVGDLFVLYTDGITEAENPSAEQFGEAGLVRVCSRHASSPLAELAAALEAELDAFTGNAARSDDRTLFLLRRCR
jgi:sigma-B regulation protein RsbU (phosphoserine phosphatase)